MFALKQPRLKSLIPERMQKLLFLSLLTDESNAANRKKPVYYIGSSLMLPQTVLLTTVFTAKP